MFLYDVDVGEMVKFSYTKTSTKHSFMCEAIVVVISGMTSTRYGLPHQFLESLQQEVDHELQFDPVTIIPHISHA